MVVLEPVAGGQLDGHSVGGAHIFTTGEVGGGGQQSSPVGQGYGCMLQLGGGGGSGAARPGGIRLRLCLVETH